MSKDENQIKKVDTGEKPAENKNLKNNLLENKVDLVTMIWAEQQQIIQFADDKANFNLVICTALFAGFSIGSGLFGAFIENLDLVTRFFLTLTGLAAFLCIVSGFLSALWVVLQRFGDITRKTSIKAVPAFHYIANKVSSAEQLYDEIINLTREELLKTRAFQAFELARIANTKMVWASRSVKSTIISVVLTTIFLVIFVLVIVLS
ncbi:MAG: hypothetical protein ACFFD4_25955 [Candidatus Odinarchaeota archaeon]